MPVGHVKETLGTRIDNDLMKNVLKKVLISSQDGWDGWVMRLFELGEGGYSPRHSHPWPHINYIVSGQGTLHLDGVDHLLQAGSFAYVPGDAIHQFLNRGEEEFRFICIVPEEGDK